MVIFNLNVLYKSDFAFLLQEKHIGIIRIITLSNPEKRQYLPHYWSDKGFNGTFERRALPSLHGGSVKITVYSPSKYWENN